jgi:carboxypeptidase family protein
MKSVAIAAITWVFFVGSLHAECVLNPFTRESSNQVRIQVALGGKPLQGAKVILRRWGDCTCATDLMRGNPLDTSMFTSSNSRMTDENGTADLPELAPGAYDVAATINDVATTPFLGLHVSDKKGVTTVSFDLTLQVQRVEDVPVRLQVAAFRGVVKDPGGGAVPGARIVVVRRGSQAKDVVLTGKADASGSFSSQLTEGAYIAVFFAQGFRPAIEPFEIAKTGSSELPVTIHVGGCP